MVSILVGTTNLPLEQLSILSIVLAFTSHFAFFIRSERDSYFKVFFSSLLLAPAAIFSTLHLYLGQSLVRSSIITGTLFVSFLLGLSASILVYRILFHPLRHFPGPFWAKTSKWWLVYTQWKTGHRYHHYARELHERYGDIVRVGPNDLSIIHPDIIPILSKANKGPWYDGFNDTPSLQSTRDRKAHAIRRRVWEKAFTRSALQDYIPRILNYSDIFLANLSETAGESVNMTQWFNCFTFDFMGDLAFGKSFGLLESKGTNGSDRFMTTMHSNMAIVGMLGHVGWFMRLILWIPGMSGARGKFDAWCGEMVEKRKQFTPEKKDIFHFLLEAEPLNKLPHHIPLTGDAQLAVVAGSDTTAATFVNIFAQLAQNPKIREKLHKEISAAYDSPYDPNHDDKVPEVIISGGTAATIYLDSVINEGLRLNPAVPSGVQRTIPDGGVTIEGSFIPGGASATYPIFVGQSNGKSFPDPLKFMPERWYEFDEETKTKQRKAFIPFWTGSYACVGKSLALMELRILTTKILRKFDIEFAKGATIEKVFESSYDTFTLMMGEVDVVFRPRGPKN